MWPRLFSREQKVAPWHWAQHKTKKQTKGKRKSVCVCVGGGARLLSGGAVEGVDQQPVRAATLLGLVCMTWRHLALSEWLALRLCYRAGKVRLSPAPAVVALQSPYTDHT